MTKNAAPPGPADATGLAPEPQTVASSGQTTGRASVTMLGALPPWRGVSFYTCRLLQALGSRPDVDMEFLDFASLYPPRLYPGGDPRDKTESAPTFSRVRVRRFLTWYNPLSWLWAGLTLKGDVVHAQWWSAVLAPVYLTVLALARLRGRRVVLTLHNIQPHESGRWQCWLNHALYRLAGHFIVHSQRNAEALVADYEPSADRVSVIPHGVPARGRASENAKRDARRELTLPRLGPVILAFGNIRRYKGLDVLLRSFRRLLDEGQEPTLAIVGQPWDSFEQYANLIDELDLGARVRTWLEYVPEEKVETFFVAADLAVLPYTRFDGQSGVAALAISFGLPLLVTDVGGLPDLVDDERVVVPPNDLEALANAMLAILKDGGLRLKLAADSKRRAGELDWGSIARQTVGVYQAMRS